MATLIRDAQISPWEEYCHLYTLSNEGGDDPHFILTLAVDIDLPLALQAVYDRGIRPPDDTVGLCMIAQAARHLTFDELSAHEDVLQEVREAMEREGRPHGDPEAVEAFYREEVIPRLPSPVELPEEMRRTGLFGLTVLRDGSVISAEAAGGDDPIGDFHEAEILKISPYPKTLYMALMGLRPDPECVDPLQAVQDREILQALDF